MAMTKEQEDRLRRYVENGDDSPTVAEILFIALEDVGHLLNDSKRGHKYNEETRRKILPVMKALGGLVAELDGTPPFGDEWLREHILEMPPTEEEEETFIASLFSFQEDAESEHTT